MEILYARCAGRAQRTRHGLRSDPRRGSGTTETDPAARDTATNRWKVAISVKKGARTARKQPYPPSNRPKNLERRDRQPLISPVARENCHRKPSVFRVSVEMPTEVSQDAISGNI